MLAKQFHGWSFWRPQLQHIIPDTLYRHAGDLSTTGNHRVHLSRRFKLDLLPLAQLDILIHELVDVYFGLQVRSDCLILISQLIFTLVGEVEHVEGCLELWSELLYFR